MCIDIYVCMGCVCMGIDIYFCMGVRVHVCECVCIGGRPTHVFGHRRIWTHTYFDTHVF